jgi:hypothetical protein
LLSNANHQDRELSTVIIKIDATIIRLLSLLCSLLNRIASGGETFMPVDPSLTPLSFNAKLFSISVAWQHLGQCDGKVLGYHAMVIVGYRTDTASKQRHYLLQNWWKAKPYVEVDGEYLANAEANVHFVTANRWKWANILLTVRCQR